MGEKLSSASIILLIIGVWFIGIAFAVFPDVETYDESSVSYGPQGFMFGTSEDLNSSKSEFKIVLSDFEFDTGRINCSVIVHPHITNKTENENVTLLLQIPHEISDVKVTYLTWQPSFTPFPSENVSYILVEIPKTNFTFQKAKNLRFDFEINQAFSKIDYFTYEATITFETSFQDVGTNQSPLSKIIMMSDNLYFFDTVRTFLHIERPENYDFPQMLPLPQRPDYWQGEPTFRWDIKSLTSEHNVISIILKIEDLISKDFFNWRSNTSFLFFGIGIPLLISSLFETLKSKSDDMFKVFKSKLVWIILLAMLLILYFISANIILWLNIDIPWISVGEETRMIFGDPIFSIFGIILGGLILYYIGAFILSLERKNDIRFLILGDFLCMAFFLLFIGFPSQISDLISSLVIAELTLALVWVELSKRPELKLYDFVPLRYSLETDERSLDYKTGYHDEGPTPSKVLGIKEVSYNDIKFDENFSFSIDLANIGYQDVMVHDYVLTVDGKTKKAVALLGAEKNKRLKLFTQERHATDFKPLGIKKSGFHTLSVTFYGATMKRSKIVWFFISDDFKKIKYVEMAPWKVLISPIIKNKLVD